LHNYISLFNYRQNCSLLNGRWLVEAVSVEASKKLLVEVEFVERLDKLDLFGGLDEHFFVFSKSWVIFLGGGVALSR